MHMTTLLIVILKKRDKNSKKIGLINAKANF